MADNTFTCNNGEQNNAQGDHATGKLVNNHGPVISTSGNQSPAIHGPNATVNYNNVSPEVLADVRKLAVTESALASFFKILEEQQVARGELDSKLREIAMRHVELRQRFESVQSDDPEVKALKEQAEQAFINGRFSEVEGLLNQIDERCDKAILQLHKIQAETVAALEKQQFCKAENLVSKAKMQRLQYRYEKSARYFQEAAAALPEGRKKERAEYLNAAGYDFHRIPRYAVALRLDEQSLSIFREISDRKGEAALLNNISQIYQAQGEYGNALDYLEQSLAIDHELGDKEGEGRALNNIAVIYLAKGDYPQALKYFKQSLVLAREAKNKENEGNTLGNIGMIHHAQGDYAAAIEQYNQALAIARKIKDKHGESTYLNNIGMVYYAQENYADALEHLEQGLAIQEQICDRQGEGITLNNIGKIYEAKEDYLAALKQYKQALERAKEIGDKPGEANRSGNIGLLYKDQGELAKAEQYLSRAVELAEQLEHPKLEKWSEALKDIRAKLREQQ